jgi:hypothetical protein
MNASRMLWPGCLVVAIACHAANASCVGMSSYVTTIGDKTVWRLYAQFDSPDDVVLVMLGIQGVPTGGFYHSDLAGGTWAPNATIDADVDTFVTIGGTPGFGNATAASPGWGVDGFVQPGIPNDASWYNPNPLTLQGKVDPNTLATFVAQFSFLTSQSQSFSCPITVAYNQGIGTPTQFFATNFVIGASVPAPAAASVMLLAFGARGRMRRRCR